MIGEVVVMFVGIVLVAVFTASLTSGLYAAAMRRTQGLRRIHRTGHVIVCGAGNVGCLVIDYLRQLGERVVVVERSPDSLLVELARDRKIDLLTGDATNDETIAFCSPERAKSLVGVTNSDTANLETALGARYARARTAQAPLHVVLRIDDLRFRPVDQAALWNLLVFDHGTHCRDDRRTRALRKHTRPLSIFADRGIRGRFNSRNASKAPKTRRLRHRRNGRAIACAGFRSTSGAKPAGRGEAIPIHKFEARSDSGDRLLFMVPLDQFSQGKHMERRECCSA